VGIVRAVEAEILPDTTPQWHVLTVESGREQTVAAHLVSRRFAMYLPMFKLAGSDRHRPLFPGYLFLFCWDFARHWGRLRMIPYLYGALPSPDCPAIIPDSIIDAIQAQETALWWPSQARPRRRWRRRAASESGSVNRVFMASYAALTRLDDAGRNSVLYKALGLCF
jgi:transcription antitermination factor NusG